jgi:hypothetical protein
LASAILKAFIGFGIDLLHHLIVIVFLVTIIVISMLLLLIFFGFNIVVSVELLLFSSSNRCGSLIIHRLIKSICLHSSHVDLHRAVEIHEGASV